MGKVARILASGAVFLTLVTVVASCGAGSADGSAEESAGSSEPSAANVEITPFRGAGVQVEFDGLVIHVDPWGRGDYTNAKPADLILITDTPGDHLDPDLIAQLRKPGAPVVLPSTPENARDEGSSERLLRVPDGLVMNNGESAILAGVPVEAVAMYDIMPGDPFHTKGEGNGYVITFMPLNLPNGRMVPTVAADCVKVLRPSVVYPYHYRELPIDEFVEALRGESDIEVRVRDWYPA
jgi:L-ascorbate metabolism protein UlaG (beta-lactamase superfamily)